MFNDKKYIPFLKDEKTKKIVVYFIYHLLSFLTGVLTGNYVDHQYLLDLIK